MGIGGLRIWMGYGGLSIPVIRRADDRSVDNRTFSVYGVRMASLYLLKGTHNLTLPDP